MTFLNKTLTLQVFYPNLQNPISERVDQIVGPNLEFDDISQYDLHLPGVRVVNADFDVAADRIHYTIDEPFGQFATTPGFNGYKISDEFNAVDPIASVTIASGQNALPLDPDAVFYSENAIFVDVDGLRYSAGDTIELIVTFGAPETAGQSVPPDVQALARLYEAAFARLPDDPGLNYWIDEHEGSRSLEEISASFLLSAEFARRYGAPESLTDEALVNLLYENILSRPGEAAGVDFWVDQVSSGQMSRPNLLVSFAVSKENVAGTDYVDDMARNISGTEWIIA